MARIGSSWRIPAVFKAAPASMVSELNHAAAHGDDLGREFRSCDGVDFQDQDLFYTANWRSNLRSDDRIGCGLRWRPNQWDPGEDDVQQMKSSSSFSVRGDRRSGGGNLVDYQFPADEEWRARLRADEEEWRARCRADDERWEAHVQASDERWESLLRAFKERLNSCMPTVRSNFQDDEVEEESLVDDASIWSEYEDDEDAEEDALPAISPARASRMPTVIRRHFAHPPDVRFNSQGTSLDLVSPFTIDSTLVWGGDDDQSDEENEEVKSFAEGIGLEKDDEDVENEVIKEGVRLNASYKKEGQCHTLDVKFQEITANLQEMAAKFSENIANTPSIENCKDVEKDGLLAEEVSITIGAILAIDASVVAVTVGDVSDVAAIEGLKLVAREVKEQVGVIFVDEKLVIKQRFSFDPGGGEFDAKLRYDDNGTYDRDGIVTQVKQLKILNFKPLRESLINPGEKDKNASHADGSSSLELLEILDAEEDDLPFGLNIDSGTLACVACGIPGYPFMAIVQPSEAVTKELFPVIGEESHMKLGKSGYSHIPSCFPNIAKFVPEGSLNNLRKQENPNSSCKASPVQFDHVSFLEGMYTFDGPEFLNDNGLRGSMNTKTNPAGEIVLSNAIVRGTKPFAETHSIHGLPTKSRRDENMKWTLFHGFNRPRIFCLQHALEVEELLHSKGGAHMLVICHSDYLKIKAYIPLIAEEIGMGIDITDVSLENAFPSDLNLINISIDDGEHEEQGEDWTSKLGVNLRYSMKLRKQSTSKQECLTLVLGRIFSGPVSLSDFSTLKWHSRRSRAPYKVVGISVAKSHIDSNMEKRNLNANFLPKLKITKAVGEIQMIRLASIMALKMFKKNLATVMEVQLMSRMITVQLPIVVILARELKLTILKAYLLFLYLLLKTFKCKKIVGFLWKLVEPRRLIILRTAESIIPVSSFQCWRVQIYVKGQTLLYNFSPNAETVIPEPPHQFLPPFLRRLCGAPFNPNYPVPLQYHFGQNAAVKEPKLDLEDKVNFKGRALMQSRHDHRSEVDGEAAMGKKMQKPLDLRVVESSWAVGSVVNEAGRVSGEQKRSHKAQYPNPTCLMPTNILFLLSQISSL